MVKDTGLYVGPDNIACNVEVDPDELALQSTTNSLNTEDIWLASSCDHVVSVEISCGDTYC